MVLERRVGGDAGAEDRRRAGQVEALGNAQDEILADHDAARVAAHGIAAIDPVGGGVADPDQIAHLVAADLRANRGDPTDDLVARHQRIDGDAPLVAGLMDIGVTHATAAHFAQPGLPRPRPILRHACLILRTCPLPSGASQLICEDDIVRFSARFRHAPDLPRGCQCHALLTDPQPRHAPRVRAHRTAPGTDPAVYDLGVVGHGHARECRAPAAVPAGPAGRQGAGAGASARGALHRAARPPGRGAAGTGRTTGTFCPDRLGPGLPARALRRAAGGG
ncbi:hypothetical protein WR25_09413 [Diploscapter pachys]|uniref:Uncharacterized protein n=1 Tax=Diploscapter pachys TaxID=2018661 RepID=A0A2A2KL48_9BILA|nr:hypothetical protein WR25_09413 [Diploscapter pachys]